MNTPSIRPKNIVLLILLTAVIWTRAWAGVPETVIHDHDHGNQSTHEEVRDHVLTVIAQDDGHSDSTDNSEHHHHLHICTGGVALLSQISLSLSHMARSWDQPAISSSPVRRTEPSLKPPIA